MKRLDQKVAIVTGSALGIGKEIAMLYAKEGAKVVVADYNLKALNEVVKEIKAKGYEAFGIEVDISKKDQVINMINKTIAKYDKIDILVNNAGVGDNLQAAANVEDEIWQRVMNINLTGTMYAIREVIPHFLKQGHGNIINMTSVAGVSGGRAGLTYTASKHAIVGMTKNVSSHYGQRGIRSNAIAPGQIETGFVAAMSGMDKEGLELATRGVNLMSRVGNVTDIANIAIFLASDESDYVNGVTITADGGWTSY